MPTGRLWWSVPHRWIHPTRPKTRAEIYDLKFGLRVSRSVETNQINTRGIESSEWWPWRKELSERPSCTTWREDPPAWWTSVPNSNLWTPESSLTAAVICSEYWCSCWRTKASFIFQPLTDCVTNQLNWNGSVSPPDIGDDSMYLYSLSGNLSMALSIFWSALSIMLLKLSKAVSIRTAPRRWPWSYNNNNNNNNNSSQLSSPQWLYQREARYFGTSYAFVLFDHTGTGGIVFGQSSTNALLGSVFMATVVRRYTLTHSVHFLSIRHKLTALVRLDSLKPNDGYLINMRESRGFLRVVRLFYFSRNGIGPIRIG